MSLKLVSKDVEFFISPVCRNNLITSYFLKFLMTRDQSGNVTEAAFRVYQDIIPTLEPKVKNTILDSSAWLFGPHPHAPGQVRCSHRARGLSGRGRHILCFPPRVITATSVRVHEPGKHSWHRLLTQRIKWFYRCLVSGGRKGTLVQGDIRPWQHRGIHKCYLKILW